MALFDSIQNLFPKQEKDTSIQGTQQDSVIQPLDEEVKKAKLSPATVDSIFQLVGSGKVLPGTVEFAKALGISGAQHGITPSATFGPFGAIRDMFSPKAQDLARKQQLANKIGTLALEQMIEMKRQQAQGPQSLQEAEQLLPGVIRPVESQRGATLDQIVGQGTQGPTQAVDPNAPLTPAQQQLASVALENLGRGQLMASGNEIVPTSFAGMQGRRVTGPEFDLLQRAATAAPGQPVESTLESLNPQVATTAANLLGRANVQNIRPVGVSNLANEMSLEKLGKPFVQATQDERAKIRPLIEKTLQNRFQFQEGQRRAGQIAVAAPLVAERARAEREQPVGGDVNKYARLNAQGQIERPQDGQLNQNQLNSQGFVDISKHQKEVDGLNDLAVIEQDFKKLKSYADELFTAGEGLAARLGQKGRLSLNKLRNSGKPTKIIGPDGQPLTTGELANIYDAEVTSMLEYYGRNLKGLRGAATEGDVARMKKNFASDWTSRKVKDQLMGDTLKLIQNIRAAGHKTIFGEKAAKASKEVEQTASMQEQIRALRAQNKSWEEIEKILTNKR